MNVRCPNCSAVFPATIAPGVDQPQVECPLCLLRFSPNAESTVSLPEMPAQLRGTAAPSPDDEFESFGSPAGAVNTRAFGPGARPLGGATGETRTTTFPPAAPPVQLLPTSGQTQAHLSHLTAPKSAGDFEFDPGGALDFDALLGGTPTAQPFTAPAPIAEPLTHLEPTLPPDLFGAPLQAPMADLHPQTPAAPIGLSFDDFGVSPGPSTNPGTDDPFGAFAGFGVVPPRPSAADEAPFGGFVDRTGETAPLSARTREGGTGLFGTPSSAWSPEPVEPEANPFDSVIVPVAVGREAPTQAAQARPDVRGAPKSKATPKFQLSAEAKSWLRRALTATVLLTLVVLLAGTALEMLGYGWFGRRVWGKPDAGVRKTTTTARALAEAQVAETPLWDTRSSYEDDIKRMEVLLLKSPKDPALNQALVDRYLDLYERFPVRFSDVSAYKTGLDNALKIVGKPPERLDAIKSLAAGEQLSPEKLAALEAGGPDDQAIALRVALQALVRDKTKEVMANPGATGGGEIDPVRQAVRDAPELAELRKKAAAIALAAKDQPNLTKFQVLQAQLADRAGAFAEILPLVGKIVEHASDNAEARTLVASMQMEQGNLDGADGLLRDAMGIADTEQSPQDKRQALLTQARLAAKRGDQAKLIASLQQAVDLVAADEVTTVRLGRLLIREKRGDDARKLLMAAKTAGMNSIAFEVVLVEFWLYANRSEDALEELGQAGKLYPESVDLLFLRAQVEDKSSHFATARDLFQQVIQHDPKHLRAILRLAELQVKSEKHDDALATLEAGRKAVGDDEALMQLQMDELVTLRREKEAREICTRLLEMGPENRVYLLRAAQLDVKLGETDRGLGYLRKLRDMRMLDRDAAYQMGLALATKGALEEAAKSVMPFAEQAPSDVDINVLAGRLLLDTKDLDHAQTMLQRAVTAANGKSAEALFQFGRLAFAKGDPTSGISRMKQAIGVDQARWEFRLELAEQLFDAKRPGARDMALEELKAIVSAETSYERSGHRVTKIGTVQGLLARHYTEQHRYRDAAEHWRLVVAAEPDNVDALTSLGEALHYAASPDALEILRKVVKRKPNDARAALYLGLSELNQGHTADAMHWFQVASAGTGPETAEAWYHMALIHRERAETLPAIKALDEYLKRAAPDARYRVDAIRLRDAVKSTATH